MFPAPAPCAAAAARPDEPVWTFELAADRIRQGDWSQARTACQALLQTHPAHTELRCNLGLIEQLLGSSEAAQGHFSRAIELDPSAPRPYLLRADLLKLGHHLPAALDDYDTALRQPGLQGPERAHAQANRASTLHALGRHHEALTGFDEALLSDVDTPGLHYNRGNALRSLGRHQEAVESFDRALALDPQDAQADFNRALSLGDLGRWQAALEATTRVVDLQPDNAEAHRALADGLKNVGRGEAALEAYDRALSLDGTMAAAHLNRGNTLRELGRAEEALAAYGHAARLDPMDWEAHYNRGIALHDLRRLPQALRAYSLARRLAPHEAQIEWNEALALLLGQHWQEGWLAFESRHRLDPLPLPPGVQVGPRWSGRSGAQAARRLLLVAEQGLGDTLQFCRYVPAVAQQELEVTLLVPPALEALLQGLHPSVQVVSSLPPGASFDAHAPVMSLPLVLRRFEPGPEGGRAYLRADPQRVEAVRERWPRRGRPRIGVAWSGNPRNPNDSHRSLRLTAFMAALPPGVEPVVLQGEIPMHDQAALEGASGWLHDPAGLEGFASTAAWCAEVDLVVSVDTSIAHLAGALGRPTWILLHQASDWRWLTDRDDTPWYPQTRLFRQSEPGRWGDVVRRVRSALEAALSDRRTGPFHRREDAQAEG